MFHFAAAVTGKPASELANHLLDSSPEQLLPLLVGLPGAGSGFRQIEPATLFCARIIYNRPFPEDSIRPFPRDNTQIGYSLLRHLVEQAKCPWPSGGLQAEIVKAVKALEARAIDENCFADTVCGAVAEEIRRLRD